MINQVSEKVFKDTKGVSYSRLSKLSESPQAYQAGLVDDPKSSAISLGTAVDLKLTQPDKFDEQIYVMTAAKPSEMMQIFCEVYAETGELVNAHAASGFKINLERVMTKFKAEGEEYYNALIKGKGKQILSAEDMFKANQIVTTLQSNPYTKKYFVPEDGVELIFQPLILWDLMYQSLIHEGKSNIVQAKSALDVIRIDHKSKTIQPVDLKTGAESFMKSFWRYKRYLQGAMYYMATHKALDDAILDDYVVENLRFVFADTNLWHQPMIYQMTDNDLHVGINGRIQKTLIGNQHLTLANHDSQWRVKGYTQLAAELEWHQKMDKWDYSYDVYQRDGEVDIDAFTFKF